jgi:hypothetical protein
MSRSSAELTLIEKKKRPIKVEKLNKNLNVYAS